MPIRSPQELIDHVETAIQIELSTVPPYLYAMLSMEDHESEPALLLRSIVVEEMLHAALTTNLLLALGGEPDFRGTGYIPTYPGLLPHHDPPLRLDLAPISPQSLVDVFMRIEQPETRGAIAEPDNYETLGQFYHAIEESLESLSQTQNLFSAPQLDRQLSDERYYRPVAYDADDSGGLMEINNLETAIDAIEVIVHQGEGLSEDRWADPEHRELTHYHKLLQIAGGASPLGSVRPVPTNPRSDEYPDLLRPVSELFNALYRGLFLVMSRIFEGGADQGRAVGVMYVLMADLSGRLGRFLVEQKLPDGGVAGPTFEVYEFESDDRVEEILNLAERCASTYPELSPVYETLRGLSFII